MTADLLTSRPQAPAPIQVRLPVGGWRVGLRVQPDGRTVVEVTDAGGSPAGLAVSSRLPILSIDAAWTGFSPEPGPGPGPGPGGGWWALAIGHASATVGPPAVTFACGTRAGRRRRGTVPPGTPGTVDGLWVAHDGLWVAAAAGHYTQVRLTAGAATRVQRLARRGGQAPWGYPFNEKGEVND